MNLERVASNFRKHQLLFERKQRNFEKKFRCDFGDLIRVNNCIYLSPIATLEIVHRAMSFGIDSRVHANYKLTNTGAVNLNSIQNNWRHGFSNSDFTFCVVSLEWGLSGSSLFSSAALISQFDVVSNIYSDDFDVYTEDLNNKIEFRGDRSSDMELSFEWRSRGDFFRQE